MGQFAKPTRTRMQLQITVTKDEMRQTDNKDVWQRWPGHSQLKDSSKSSHEHFNLYW